jgi:mRNA-degrading endonuclease RelE of RelBE toxin-antitoxin system
LAYNLIVTEIAELHALEAAIYYEEQLRDLSERFLSELEDIYKKIAEHPEYYSYVSLQDVYRDISLDKFPFVVIYQVHDNDVIIVDVFNTNRNPLL